MSTNRSIQAAQRRRTAPAINDNVSRKGPQQSINSAQVFANQARPGTGPNIPTGRLAGQHAAMQQQHQQQAYYQQGQNQAQEQSNKLSNVSKMTISQAITLITLRLGAIESKLMNVNFNQMNCFNEDSEVTTDFLQSIVSRLESIEKSQSSDISNSTTPTNNNELTILNQQIESVKQSVKQLTVQNKNLSVSLNKEITSLKTQTDNIKKEISEINNTVMRLQNITIENSQKLLELNNFSTADLNLEMYVPEYNENDNDNNNIIDDNDSANDSNIEVEIEPNNLI